MDRIEECLSKIERVRRWLAGAGVDGVLLRSQANFAWITAGGSSHVETAQEQGVATVAITGDRAAVVTSNIESQRLVDEELPAGCFEIFEYQWHSPDRQDQLVEAMAGSRVASDSVPGLGLNELRRVLLPPEIDRYRLLAQDAALVVESACRSVELRESELELSGRVAAACRAKSILPVVNLVAADERIARYRHPLPTAHRIDRSALVALTARRNGLHVSLTRTVCFGKPDSQQRDRHETCVRVDARMIQSSVAGSSLADVLASGRRQYEAEGFPEEWERHHQGGSTGYAGREVFATPTTDDRIQINQALTWNPSVPGAKSEDTILVTEHGLEVMSSTGHWPELSAEIGEAALSRPGLLIRER